MFLSDDRGELCNLICILPINVKIFVWVWFFATPGMSMNTILHSRESEIYFQDVIVIVTCTSRDGQPQTVSAPYFFVHIVILREYFSTLWLW